MAPFSTGKIDENLAQPLVATKAAVTATTHHVAHRIVLQESKTWKKKKKGVGRPLIFLQVVSTLNLLHISYIYIH